MPDSRNSSLSTARDHDCGLTPQLRESAFMKACRREKTPYTPVWLMRQAGRYQAEFREIRSKVGLLELCKTPELAAQVTVHAVNQLEVDAAIIFADILLPLDAFGNGLDYVKGEGPVIARPVRTAADIDKLPRLDAREAFSYVLEAIRITRRELPANVPLIGFAGAPFTMASYLIEGGSSRNYENTKTLMYCQSESWHKLLSHIVDLSVDYLNAQADAGAQALQIFDSWVGALSVDDYMDYVFPHAKRLIAGLTPGVPVIHFGTGTACLLEAMRDAGGDVIGVDWRMNMKEARRRLGNEVAIQGNMDPVALLADRETIRRKAEGILRDMVGDPGHIFNLGHGVLPPTSVDNAKFLVDLVHRFSSGNSDTSGGGDT